MPRLRPVPTIIATALVVALVPAAAACRNGGPSPGVGGRLR